MTDAEEIVTMLIDEARGQIALQSSNADSHDTKALALLGADIAAGLAILSLHAVQTSRRSNLRRSARHIRPLVVDSARWRRPVGHSVRLHAMES